MHLLRLLVVVLGLAASSVGICAERNVLLVVTDDQGRDAGCYGNQVLKTPNLDALAADGTLFTNAYCSTASCSSSRSVILSGLHNHATLQYGLEHSFHHFRSRENMKTLPVLLAEAGYRTAQVGKFHVGPERVYRFQERLKGGWRDGVGMAEACRHVIEDPSDKPFFVYYCTADPHRDGAWADEIEGRPNRFGNKPRGKSYPEVEPVHYDPEEVIVPPFLPDTVECRAELAQYYEAISRADAGLGRLIEILKEAGKYDQTLIVFISDNGSPFPGAKATVYEPGIRLPCVVRDPTAQKRGVRNEAFVSWADLTPTILEFAQVEPPAETKFQGRSFLSILEEEHPEGWDEVYASHTFHEVTMYYPMRVVRKGPFKLIWNIAHELPYSSAGDLWNSATWQATIKQGENASYGMRTVKSYLHRPEFELYNLETDPYEARNLADDPAHGEKLAELKQSLREFQKRTSDPWLVKWERE